MGNSGFQEALSPAAVSGEHRFLALVNRLSATPHAATAISTPPDSAGAWLRERPVLIGDRKWLRRNRGSIREAESARPGFADKLRQAALELLNYPDSDQVRRSMAVLAVVGVADDVPALRRAAAAGGVRGEDGRAAIDEIENRAAAGQDPLQVLQGPSLWNRIARSLVGLYGAGSVALGIAGFVIVLRHPGTLHMRPMLRGLSVIAFGCWLIWIARRGKLPQ